ncbi:MAG: VWA domain-containing protein [Chloroflexi bacterium]|nr:VWA domain-containing protein [Chloroflexota bacterium]
MGLLWPTYLLFLATIPLVVLAYVLVLRRRRRFAVHYSSLSLIRQAMPPGIRWRRHLPFVLIVLALALLFLAMSRPFANVTVASSRTTVMLALDVSLSMCADDIYPNRLTVAQDAAERFIESQESGTQVGIVAFAGIAQLIVPPTTDREILNDAVSNLTTARMTAVGSAITRSLDALAEINPNIPATRVYSVPIEERQESFAEDNMQPDVIVLLTDGASNRGVFPLVAAQAARDRGVRVYTIGFGTTTPSILQCTPEQLGTDDLANRIGRGGFGRFGRVGFLQLDEQTLSSVAEMTGAEYYLAESADELLDVFATIPVQLRKNTVRMEVSALFTALASLLALAAVALGLRWNPLP